MAIAPTTTKEATGGDDVRTAARQLEAYFVRRVFAEIRNASAAAGSDGLGDGGFAGSTFREMLDEALSDKVAESGGLGLAKTLERQLSPESARPAAPATTGPAAPIRSTTRARAAYGEGALGVAPVEGRETSGFGRRADPIEGDARMHAGLDLAAPLGTPVRAAGGGVVVQAGPARSYGNLVVIDHGGGVQTRYGHLDHADVRAGDRVSAGEAIGAVGQTGRATGPHLHLEVRRDGEAVDPKRAIPALKFPR